MQDFKNYEKNPYPKSSIKIPRIIAIMIYVAPSDLCKKQSLKCTIKKLFAVYCMILISYYENENSSFNSLYFSAKGYERYQIHNILDQNINASTLQNRIFDTSRIVFKSTKDIQFSKTCHVFPINFIRKYYICKIAKLNTKKMNILTFCLLQQVLERQLQFLSFITYARPPGVSEGF